jgi:hypothetical protein
LLFIAYTSSATASCRCVPTGVCLLSESVMHVKSFRGCVSLFSSPPFCRKYLNEVLCRVSSTESPKDDVVIFRCSSRQETSRRFPPPVGGAASRITISRHLLRGRDPRAGHRRARARPLRLRRGRRRQVLGVVDGCHRLQAGEDALGSRAGGRHLSCCLWSLCGDDFVSGVRSMIVFSSRCCVDSLKYRCVLRGQNLLIDPQVGVYRGRRRRKGESFMSVWHSAINDQEKEEKCNAKERRGE